MGQFQWSPEHEVFIAQLDAEHRDLFEIAGGFEQALERHAPPAESQDYLRSLVEHLQDHLSHEEWLMQSVEYPSYSWHKQQHETARRRLKLFVPLVESGDAEATAVFLEFLSGWLHDHTSVTDRMMAAYVRNYERSHATDAFERWAARAPSARRAQASAGSEALPKTVHFCKICGAQTSHEMRPEGMVCQACAAHSVRAELDRD